MTRSTVAASARFRQRKLTTKQALQILREDQIDSVDDEAQRNVPKVETGVEKGEEVVSRDSAYVIWTYHIGAVRIDGPSVGTPSPGRPVRVSSCRCRR